MGLSRGEPSMNRANTALLVVVASLPSIVAGMLIIRSQREPTKPVLAVITAPVTVVTLPPAPSLPSPPPPVRLEPEPRPQQLPDPQTKPSQELVVNVSPAPVIVVTPPPVKSEPKPHLQWPPDIFTKPPRKPSAPPSPWIPLFNGTDVSDWTTGRSLWGVSGGVL